MMFIVKGSGIQQPPAIIFSLSNFSSRLFTLFNIINAMELFSIVWHFLLLWACIYVVVFALQIISTRKKDPAYTTRRKHANNTLLPMSIVDESSSSEHIEKDQWSIKLFQVKYTTQRLNKLFASLTKFAPNFWNIWFGLGVITASILMVVGMGVILYAGIKILSSLQSLVWTSSDNSSSRHAKRAFEGSGGGGQDDEQVFLPMVRLT